jgi:hypothetical protein
MAWHGANSSVAKAVTETVNKTLFLKYQAILEGDVVAGGDIPTDTTLNICTKPIVKKTMREVSEEIKAAFKRARSVKGEK